jgi:hypothetical protein
MLLTSGVPTRVPAVRNVIATASSRIATVLETLIERARIEAVPIVPAVTEVQIPDEGLDPSLVARVRSLRPDVLVVLGARVRQGRPGRHLLQRVATASALFDALDRRPTLLLTGGHGEALAMRDLLVARGVPREHLLLETRARSTVQNAAFSMQLLDRVEEPVRTVLVITTAVLRRGRVYDDHAARALANFSRVAHHVRLAAVSVNAEPWVAPRMYVGSARSAHAGWRAER